MKMNKKELKTLNKVLGIMVKNRKEHYTRFLSGEFQVEFEIGEYQFVVNRSHVSNYDIIVFLGGIGIDMYYKELDKLISQNDILHSTLIGDLFNG